MLKITPYLGILVLIVSIGGLWFPKLGYFLLIVFLTLLIISPFKGRWFCGNLCPRGSFNDFWISKISLKKKIPNFLKKLWIRIPIFIMMMGFMTYRLINTSGMIDKIGMVFVIMCLTTTIISTVFGIFISPRTWCTFCPMGTVQKMISKDKTNIIVDKSICKNCGICLKACPMQIKITELKSDHTDCIRCQRCINACPYNALTLSKR